MKKKNNLLEKLFTLILAAVLVVYLVIALTILGMPLDQLEGASLIVAGQAVLTIIEDLGVITKLYHVQIYLLAGTLLMLFIIIISNAYNALKIRYLTGGLAAVVGLFGMLSVHRLVDRILVPLLHINATTADGATRFLQTVQEVSNTSFDSYLVAGYAIVASAILTLLAIVILLVCIIRKK